MLLVAGQDLAAGFQDSFYFRQAVVYVLQVVQDMVGHHHIKAGFGVGQAHAIANSQSFATGRVVKQHVRRKIQREIAEVGFSLKQLRIMIAAPATEIEHDFVPLPYNCIEGPTHKIEFWNGEFGVGFVFDPQVLVRCVIATDALCLRRFRHLRPIPIGLLYPNYTTERVERKQYHFRPEWYSQALLAPG